MSEKTAFVMPEDEWIALCRKQCVARSKEHGEDKDYCDEHGGLCPECVSDAAARVPQKYRRTTEFAEQFDRLPGCER